MQEPEEPIEPNNKIIFETKICSINTYSFSALSSLEEQFNYLKNKCNKYKQELGNATLSNIIDFKIKILNICGYFELDLVVLEEQEDLNYDIKLKEYEYELEYYKQQLEEYNVYKKQLYLQLKKEFDAE